MGYIGKGYIVENNFGKGFFIVYLKKGKIKSAELL